MPKEVFDNNYEFLPQNLLLSFEEITRLTKIFVAHGVEKIRLTGGEPLLRPDIVDIVARINSLPNPPKLSLTTNGIRLAELAQPLKDAGLERVNVSLDTLDAERFKKMTFRDRFDDVMKGLKAARDADLAPVKINTVLMPGVNDDEAVALVKWALEEGFKLRFIEQMPLDAGGVWDRLTMKTADDIFAALNPVFSLTPVETRGSAPAEEFLINGGPETVGIIASVTRPFCGACDRLRLTADGQLRSCLFATKEMDLRDVLRSTELSEEQKHVEIASRFDKTVVSKLPGHGINDPSFIQPARPMSAIGG
jgi:cyclic pyranopterin phosphate synthase